MQAILGRFPGDANFQLASYNANTSLNGSGSELFRLGQFYNGTWGGGFRFQRGAGGVDTTIAFNTNGADQGYIDGASGNFVWYHNMSSSGNLSANGSVVANGTIFSNGAYANSSNGTSYCYGWDPGYYGGGCFGGNTVFNGTLTTNSNLIAYYGRIGVGTGNPPYPLTVIGTSSFPGSGPPDHTGDWHTYYTFNAANGTNGGAANVSIYSSGGVAGTEFDAFSDRRIKTNIENLDLDNSINFLKKVKPVVYQLKEDHSRHYGFIAQDIIKAGYSEFVNLVKAKDLPQTSDPDGFVSPKNYKFTLDYSKITSILTKSSQYFLEKITQHDKAIDELKRENAEMKAYLCVKDKDAPFCQTQTK